MIAKRHQAIKLLPTVIIILIIIIACCLLDGARIATLRSLLVPAGNPIDGAEGLVAAQKDVAGVVALTLLLDAEVVFVV